MNKSVKNAKNKKLPPVNKKSSKKKQQQKRSTINGLPIHLDTPKGRTFSCPCADGYILRTAIARQLTLPQLNAMRKCIVQKVLEIFFVYAHNLILIRLKNPQKSEWVKVEGLN